MKPSEYITFSQREKIENPKIAEILDYCERHFDFEIIEFGKEIGEDFYKFRLSDFGVFLSKSTIEIYYKWMKPYYSHLDIFYGNYVGILGSLKNFK